MKTTSIQYSEKNAETLKLWIEEALAMFVAINGLDVGQKNGDTLDYEISFTLREWSLIPVTEKKYYKKSSPNAFALSGLMFDSTMRDHHFLECDFGGEAGHRSLVICLDVPYLKTPKPSLYSMNSFNGIFTLNEVAHNFSITSILRWFKVPHSTCAGPLLTYEGRTIFVPMVPDERIRTPFEVRRIYEVEDLVALCKINNLIKMN